MLDQEFIEVQLLKGILIWTMAGAWRHGGTARARRTWASSGHDCDEACVAWTDSAAWKVQPGHDGMDMVQLGQEVVEAHGDSLSMLVCGLEAGGMGWCMWMQGIGVDARHRINLWGVDECEGMAGQDMWGHPCGNVRGEARIEKETR